MNRLMRLRFIKTARRFYRSEGDSSPVDFKRLKVALVECLGGRIGPHR